MLIISKPLKIFLKFNVWIIHHNEAAQIVSSFRLSTITYRTVPSPTRHSQRGESRGGVAGLDPKLERIRTFQLTGVPGFREEWRNLSHISRERYFNLWAKFATYSNFVYKWNQCSISHWSSLHCNEFKLYYYILSAWK